MSFPRTPLALTSRFFRPSHCSSPRAPLVLSQQRLYAGSSYGGGEGDPKGETPQDQGSNPSADLEHPGPPPVAEGQGSGGGPTKAHASGHNTKANASSSGSGGGESDAGSKGSSSGAQPKIHSDSASKEHSEDVQQHNRDMDNRHGRAAADSADEKGTDDRVGKGFWGGLGGADRQP
ncbi:MAG: hypothetical protein M1835_005740 [Candelina submexicana]|nr:MAG: hypothetical protein M1835_005740 [Candelina submexicana]